MKLIFTTLSLLFTSIALAQNPVPDTTPKEDTTYPAAPKEKKPLTHDVYDKWESIGERGISPNGQTIFYVVNPQEGDGNLYINTPTGTLLRKIPRAYGATVTNDNNFIIGKIKPLYKDTREARIKKKRPDEMPKDSLFVYDIAKDSLQKIAKVKSYKIPEKGSGWVAYLLEKADAPRPKVGIMPDSTTQINNVLRMADSLRNVADSLVLKTKEAKDKGLVVLLPPKKDVKPTPKPEDPVEEGTDLVLRNLTNGKETTFKLTNEYYFAKNAPKLLLETSKKNGDTTSKAKVLWHNLVSGKTDTIFVGFNDAKNYAISEDATQLAFVAEKDSAAKALQKFYKLYYYNSTMSTASMQLDKQSTTMPKGLTVSPDYNNAFSKDGEQLFFGIAPIRKPKDTTIVEFETARLDVWNYKDDYLQPQQLVQLNQELRRSYTSVWHTKQGKWVRLATDTTESIQPINEGNAKYVLATSNYNNRAAAQWQGFAKTNAYVINTNDGSTKRIFSNERANAGASPMGKYILWYDWDNRAYFTYNVATAKKVNISKAIKTPVWDEDDDHPDAPPPHGIMRWAENDAYVYIYDKYDIWQCDPTGVVAPKLMTNGRKNKVITRWNNTDAEDRFLVNDKPYLFHYFSEITKMTDVNVRTINNLARNTEPALSTVFRGYVRAKDSTNSFIYTCENPQQSPYILSYRNTPNEYNKFAVDILHQPNKQQEDYVWYQTELESWKMLDGKRSEGILYKPENLDPNKKYPIIFYFYERNADDLYNYKGPAPSASTINIPYFVSNGYIVFDPNIYYKNGEPGESAYNSIVSAARYLTKKYKWIDSTKMAIQGQSWGGYQVAYLITRTNMFAAAGAGAPVSNMTSAYGGIRWGTGISRQFQYERSQTRLGASLWQKRDLYIKNSPLFFADKVKTPLLMMHNDKDGAVPWYQGIEYFTALKRLDKKVWLLQYNDEDHNLVERRNRKDLSIRLGQFFDHYLKGKPMPKWMLSGVKAVDKGIEWGLEIAQ